MQCAFADGGQPFAQCTEGLIAAIGGELGAEAVEVAEDAVVDDADEAIELHQRVLQGRGREQHLRVDVRHCLFERLGDDVAGLVDVTQAMSFIENDQVPCNLPDIAGLGLGELI